MELIEHFGIDPILIAAQIVNFLVIFFILKRFVYKPLFATFKKRETLIKESITKADESKKALEKAVNEEKEIIKKAKTTANQVIKDAQENAAVIIKEAEEDARKKTQAMLEEAKMQIAKETKLAEQELNKHVGQLAVGILRKSLGGVFSDKEQEEVVKKAEKALKNAN